MNTWKGPSILAFAAVLVPLVGFAQEAQAPRSFLRGDADADGQINVTDAIFTFGWLFLGAEAPGCMDAADSNDDGVADLSDGIFTLGYLFTGGQSPPYPGPGQCDLDPTPDDLGCAGYSPCSCGGFVGRPCPGGDFCDMPPGSCDTADMLGYCVPSPGGCPKNLDPVCGCDGTTYANDCERIRAGVWKDHDGECEGPPPPVAAE